MLFLLSVMFVLFTIDSVYSDVLVVCGRNENPREIFKIKAGISYLLCFCWKAFSKCLSCDKTL